ncbi:SRF-like protein [Basidiobolus meristosporus CBS 931.73]|uniref:SRF-like protein n=1 Tax=Basidiobolus meristosporus CBS 931.73 TaxID=1314790 RepID=A0A1Y1Y408_9FUNG|nr:SRF-like protein [Basidiobolus meristosporus CBS 931.73]|eukprot:ORX92750.1 SRF-like protein [Basidiobolus meristosporus CBS 931.73]
MSPSPANKHRLGKVDKILWASDPIMVTKAIMGRKKIKIKTIENERQKNVTFSRRRCGLIKKAHELAVLCECKVVLMMFDAKDACHIYSSVDDPEGLIEKYYRKEFKTVDNRRRKSAPNTSSDSTNKPAIVNEYKISTNGEGSENIQVKHTKNEHNPGAVLLSLNADEAMSYSSGFPESSSNYDYLLDGGGVGYRDASEPKSTPVKTLFISIYVKLPAVL